MRVRRARELCYRFNMTVEDIDKAIAKLGPRELDKFRAWFEEFQAARFDDKIERDVHSGKLDRLADQASADFRKGSGSNSNP